MLLRFGWVLVSACLLASCTQKVEAVRAAQPYVEDFGELRLRALSLLELRSGVERQRLLLRAMNGEKVSLPDNLKPLLEQMRREREEVTDQRLEQGDALFWRMLDYTFSSDPNVLQAEIAFLEKDGTVSTFRHPRERELPAGLRWYGLRQHRTFAALGTCVSDEGSEPCVLLQLRPRDYAGSAGLTVAYRRRPIEVRDDREPDR